MIRVECPHCNRRYRTKLEAIGRTAVCTLCHESFKIGETRPAFEWKPTDIAEDSWIGVEPPKEKEELKHCIMCEAPMEPGSVVCPACGANQVTGLVHRAKPKVPMVKAPFWSVMPIRPILVAVTVLVVGVGAYWAFRSLSRSAVQTGEQWVYQRIMAEANKYLREGRDESAFAQRFSGQVNDSNLPFFLRMLSANDRGVQRAAVLLIGCSNITQLEPILSRDHATTQKNDGQDPKITLQVLDAIGLRRIIDLSGNESKEVRQSAAQALCLLSSLPRDDATITQLAAPVPPTQKIETLNMLCRPWPQATGRFAVVVDQTEAPFEASIEQIGRTFLMQIQSAEFRSSLDGRRLFEIPIERWCAATGIAVDPTAIQKVMSGSVQLASVHGVVWEGAMKITAKQDLAKPPSGFLPITSLNKGETAEAVIRLERR